MTPLRIRQATQADVPRLVEMNVAAYPELVADGIVFDPSQIAAHLAVFPEGQLVAVSGERIVGAIATLIVTSARAAAAHTWVEITSHGTFAGHDPGGDVLYLADVYADPSVRSQGVGAALYEALFALCRRKQPATSWYPHSRRAEGPGPHVAAARGLRDPRRPDRLPG